MRKIHGYLHAHLKQRTQFVERRIIISFGQGFMFGVNLFVAEKT